MADTTTWEGPKGRGRPRGLLPGLVLLAIGGALVALGLPVGEGERDELVGGGERNDAENAGAEDADGAAGADDADGAADVEDEPVGEPPTLADDAPEPARQPETTVARLPEAEGSLYVRTRGTLTRVELATGERTARDVSFPPAGQSGPQSQLMATADRVIMVATDAWPAALAPDLSGEKRELAGEGDIRDIGYVERVFEGAPGTVTIVTRGAMHTMLHVVAVDDGELQHTRSLPIRAQVLGARGSEVVVAVAGDIFRYDVTSGTGERLATGSPLAADDEHVVYVRCSTDLTCGAIRQGLDESAGRMVREFDQQPYPGANTLSPDGRWLLAWQAAGQSRPTPILLDLRSGEIRESPPGHGLVGRPLQTWTTDGQWLLVADGTTVSAWRPEDDALVKLDLGLGGPGIEALAAGP